MEIKDEFVYKGTRIILGGKTKQKRDYLKYCTDLLESIGYQEISIPIIQFQSTFKNKVGEENNNMMFSFKDRGDRDICLAPEYTAIIQLLAKTKFKFEKNLKVFYIAECFRGEKPQKGRYRQFTQLGVEIINPTENTIEGLSQIASELISGMTKDIKINFNVTRGLDYYKEGKGFEIEVESLGAQKQICGGGEYDGGAGFAIGIDRLLEI